MKYVILLGDGMADLPIASLDGRTPIEYANTPNMDRMASSGIISLIDTIPAGLPPGSDVANLAVLGYDSRLFYSGRAPFEAASMGIQLSATDVAFRCNLVTLGNLNEPEMEDFTAGHISATQAALIMADLNAALKTDEFHFYPGLGYRNLLVWKHGKERIKTTPPHDITGKKVAPYLPEGEDAHEINALMGLSQQVLADHPVNKERVSKGLKPAISIWLWGQGRAPQIKKFRDKFQIKGGMISAVDLLKGIAVNIGLEILKVKGATGYTDTNYIGKAKKALWALEHLDFVFVHVEATDEMGHEGNLEGKIKAIEDFDKKVVGTVLEGLPSFGDYRVAVLSDHPTPIALRTHIADPSPLAILSSRPEENQNRGIGFGEKAAKMSGNMVSPGFTFMERFAGDLGKLFG
jgi:2,3-bisphosphoglycerate-independent phosphoglycerate mutase